MAYWWRVRQVWNSAVMLVSLSVRGCQADEDDEWTCQESFHSCDEERIRLLKTQVFITPPPTNPAAGLQLIRIVFPFLALCFGGIIPLHSVPPPLFLCSGGHCRVLLYTSVHTDFWRLFYLNPLGLCDIFLQDEEISLLCFSISLKRQPAVWVAVLTLCHSVAVTPQCCTCPFLHPDVTSEEMKICHIYKYIKGQSSLSAGLICTHQTAELHLK